MAECHEKSLFGPVAKVYKNFGIKTDVDSNNISGNPTHAYTIHFDSENGGNIFLRNCGNPG